MKSIIKTKILKQEKYCDDKTEILIYEIENEEWDEENIRSKNNILDKMLTHAQNKLTTLASTKEINNRYIVVEVELPGMKTMRCEGKIRETTTILYPIPSPLTRIVFLKKEGLEVKPVHIIEFSGEKWVYDTVINSKDLEYDAILVETLDNKRIILKEELIGPIQKIVRETRKKKRRRKRKRRKTISKKKKKEKETRKKKSKKKSRRKRKRRGRKK